MEIIQERLEREYDLDLVTTAPSVVYRVDKKDGTEVEIHSPSKLPPLGEIADIREPLAQVVIHLPDTYVGPVLKLCQDRRGTQVGFEVPTQGRVILTYQIPYAEVVYDFFDKLKSVSRGYASMDYEVQDWVVADLGCGTGNGAALLAPFVGRIVAVDREPTMLDAARKRLRDVDNVEFMEGELDSLPLENGQFDAAMFFLVLHHQPDPMPALAEAARIVRPGGVILIVDMVAHDRENYRHTMGHQHLGFDEATVAGWAADAGLSPPRYRRLHPDTQSKGQGLFAATMWKPA